MKLDFSLARFRFNAFSSTRRKFYQDFASALRADTAARDRLVKLSERARQRRNGWAPLYEYWLRKMKRMSFGHALQGTVPAYEVMVLTAAEEDARLADGMDFMARAIQLATKARGAYVMSLLSPALGFVSLLAFMFANALFIGPQNLQSLPYAKWPALSKILYVISNSVVTYLGLYSAGLAALVCLVMWSRGNWSGRLRAKIDRVPMLPWRGYRNREAINFLVSFAILLQSNNHGPKEALSRMRKFATPWLSWHIGKMLQRLKLAPEFPARALDTGLFAADVMDRIDDYAERADFNVALHGIAFDNGDEALEAANKKAMLGAFMLMFLLAGIIGLIAMSTYQFNDAMQSYLNTTR
jgi:type II secretory pathway component PulF